jgi:hypothetical protein
MPWIGWVYAVLMAAFGWIVWKSAPPNRALRVVGALLMAHTVFGQFWPPMHQRAVLAAGGGAVARDDAPQSSARIGDTTMNDVRIARITGAFGLVCVALMFGQGRSVKHDES